MKFFDFARRSLDFANALFYAHFLQKPSCTFITVAKRHQDLKMPPLKKARETEVDCPPALPQMQPSSLPQFPCQLDVLLNYSAQINQMVSKLSPKVLEILSAECVSTVLLILCEQWNTQASLISVTQKWKTTILSFGGLCPLHRCIHGNNHWCLINTIGYNTTLFLCHHDSSRRTITHRLPFM